MLKAKRKFLCNKASRAKFQLLKPSHTELFACVDCFAFAVLRLQHIIGASVSEPHIDEFAVNFLCIVRTSCCKSLPALILHILTSCVNSKTLTIP